MAHYQGTGPEIWQQTKGKVTHFVSSMGTTGTIMGTSRYLKEQKQDVRIIGLQPKEGSAIAGIRRWPKEYLPTIFQVILACIYSTSTPFMFSAACTCCAHHTCWQLILTYAETVVYCTLLFKTTSLM